MATAEPCWSPSLTLIGSRPPARLPAAIYISTLPIFRNNAPRSPPFWSLDFRLFALLIGITKSLLASELVDQLMTKLQISLAETQFHY